MKRVEPNRNVYVGHRYVPLLVGEWDKSIQYEGISIVTFKGGSYTSKKMTPPGIDIENEEYWVLTGNYNAQVEYYRLETERVADDLAQAKIDLNKRIDDTVQDVDSSIEDLTIYVNDEVRKNKEYVDDEVEELTGYVNDETSSTRQYVDDETSSTRQYVDDETASARQYVDGETASARQYVDDETSSTRQYVNGEVTTLNHKVNNLGISIVDFIDDVPNKNDDRKNWDWSQALRNAISEATNEKYSGGQNSIFFPEGIYKVKHRVFNGIDELGIKRGLTFRGVGNFSSVLYLDTGNTESWFYDNGVENQEMEMLSFYDLGFTGDNGHYINMFKLWSKGSEKQFRFFNCAFGRDVSNAIGEDAEAINVFFETHGTGNSDLCRFDNCSISGVTGKVFRLNNSQSVVFETSMTDIITHGADIVEIGPQGGGSMHFMGGSWIHTNRTDGDDSYVLKIPEGSAQGFGNGEMNFNDIRFEFHGGKAGIMFAPDSRGHTQANFNGCNLGVSQDGELIGVHLNNNKRLKFNDCIIHESQKFKLHGTNQASPNSPVVIMDNCLLGSTEYDIYDRFILDGYYRVIGINNRQHAGVARYPHTPGDFDIGFENPLPRDPASTVKYLPVLFKDETFPRGDSPRRHEFKVSPGSLILRMYVFKERTSGSVEPYSVGLFGTENRVLYGRTEDKEMREEINTMVEINKVTNDGLISFEPIEPGVPQNHPGMVYIEYI